MSEEDRNAWETGRYGSGPPPSGGSQLDAWQQGQAIKNLNDAELQRQAAAGSGSTFSPSAPTFPAGDPTAPSGGWSPSGGGTTLSGGGTTTSGGGLGCLLVPVLIILGLQLWVCLYPLSGLATLGSAVGVYLLLQSGLPKHPGAINSSAVVIAFIIALVVLVVTSRLEQRLGRRAAYRIPRHVVRLGLFGLAANMVFLNYGGRAFIRPSFAYIWRPFETPVQTAVVLGAIVGMHFLMWTDNGIRDTWHGLLEAIRLR